MTKVSIVDGTGNLGPSDHGGGDYVIFGMISVIKQIVGKLEPVFDGNDGILYRRKGKKEVRFELRRMPKTSPEGLVMLHVAPFTVPRGFTAATHKLKPRPEQTTHEVGYVKGLETGVQLGSGWLVGKKFNAHLNWPFEFNRQQASFFLMVIQQAETC